jgi:hypothetical protein
MIETKISGALLVAIPGAVQNYIKANTTKAFTHYSVYLWLDEDRALYLRGQIPGGRSSGSFMGRYASQIGTNEFADLRILRKETLQEALTNIKSVQIDSKEVNWSGSFKDFVELIGVSNLT